jgi:hypothetical protein
MPTDDDPVTALSRLTYEEALGAVARQQHVLDSLRGRAQTLFSSAAITTSFLGGRTVAAGSIRATTWLAIACFAIVGLVSTATLWPRLKVEMTTGPLVASEVRKVEHADRSAAALLLALADHLRVSYLHNEACVARIATFLRISTVFLTFEVVWWVADLATRG